MNYVIKNRIISIINLLTDKITKSFLKIIVTFSKVLFLFLIVSILFNIKVLNALEINNDKLIEKISNDYTNKFCNSIAFGLSKDSAMNFANKENNIIFNNKKGRDDLIQEQITNAIAISVVENCGYLVDLKGEQGIMEFKKDYNLINNY